MTPTQEHLLKLLLEIDEICKRHDIEFFLEAGTAIGGVRHEGFIPWDNDVDIAMTPANYEKFRRVCAEELDGVTRTFYDNRMNRDYPKVFGHYIDLESCRFARGTNYWEHVGQNIDVFEYIPLPPDLEENRRISNLFYAYDEFVNQCQTHFQRKTDDIYNLYRELQKRAEVEGREAVLQSVEKEIFSYREYEGSYMAMCNSARMNWTTFMPKHAFDTTREVMFEGHPMRVPGDWYETLTCNYGDDFGIIPTAQKLHLEMSHTGLPAQPYIDDFLQAITKDQIANHLKEYKEASLEYGYQKTKVVVDFHHARGVLIKRQLQQRIDASGESLTALMDENTLESAAKIAEILGDYVDLQVNARLLKWHAHFGASDEIDEAVAYTLMIQGKSRKVDQFLGMRIHNGIGITERMKQIRFAAHQVRCLKKHWHYGEYEKGREYLAWAKENLPALEEIRAFELLYEYVEATDEATKRAVLAHAEALLTEFPENHRMRKVQADCQFDLGDTEAARAGYTWLIENTRNGFILNDIRKKPLDLPEFKA